MSTLRPECRDAEKGSIAMPPDTALFLIRDSVERRRGLIHGRLTNQVGQHCALGCFWEDNPRAVLNTTLIEEVAAVNDSLGPLASARERWEKVDSWLRWKIKVMAGATK